MKILFHIRLNLMFLLVAGVSMVLRYMCKTATELIAYQSIGIVFAGVFLIETIFGIINHDKLYGQDN